ncbi:unnamed protein product [Prorocentrum cordatum]|uniref:J domain-containing protein n=1 Tax=Prorocentrum cordatum TaxID=2364126 RepID=A0ABN9X280_9DINO|nr:unnamed protein product [Polarella glacialis]
MGTKAGRGSMFLLSSRLGDGVAARCGARPRRLRPHLGRTKTKTATCSQGSLSEALWRHICLRWASPPRFGPRMGPCSSKAATSAPLERGPLGPPVRRPWWARALGGLRRAGPPGARPGAQGAEPDVLKRAYRRAVLRWHPDSPGGSAERLQEVRAAFEFLGRELPEAGWRAVADELSAADWEAQVQNARVWSDGVEVAPGSPLAEGWRADGVDREGAAELPLAAILAAAAAVLFVATTLMLMTQPPP